MFVVDVYVDLVVFVDFEFELGIMVWDDVSWYDVFVRCFVGGFVEVDIGGMDELWYDDVFGVVDDECVFVGL